MSQLIARRLRIETGYRGEAAGDKASPPATDDSWPVQDMGILAERTSAEDAS
jgi:hypothetical protein